VLIFSKQKIILNTDVVKYIEVFYNFGQYEISADYISVAEYDTEERAQQVLKQIFIATTDKIISEDRRKFFQCLFTLNSKILLSTPT